MSVIVQTFDVHLSVNSRDVALYQLVKEKAVWYNTVDAL